MRNQKDAVSSKAAYNRNKERLDRQRNARDNNREAAMRTFGIEPSETCQMDILSDFTLNKKEMGYGWVVVAIVVVVFYGIWQAWAPRALNTEGLARAVEQRPEAQLSLRIS